MENVPRFREKKPFSPKKCVESICSMFIRAKKIGNFDFPFAASMVFCQKPTTQIFSSWFCRINEYYNMDTKNLITNFAKQDDENLIF